MTEAEQKPVEEFTKVESIFVRQRNCLLLRADFSPMFVDYYLHLMQHGLRNEETEDTVLKHILSEDGVNVEIVKRAHIVEGNTAMCRKSTDENSLANAVFRNSLLEPFEDHTAKSACVTHYVLLLHLLTGSECACKGDCVTAEGHGDEHALLNEADDLALARNE